MTEINLTPFVAKRVKEIRKSKKLSQEALSIAAGLDPKYINKLENLRYNARFDTLEKILETLEVSYSEFFQFEIKTSSHKIEELLQVITQLSEEEQEVKLEAIIKLLS